jgi:hypothetical protein
MTLNSVLCGFVFLSLLGLTVSPRCAFVRGPEPKQAFDRYGNIRWEDEKARLDNFAIQLLQDENYFGYIWVLQGPEMCPDEAAARAIRAKIYLVHYRHVPWNRVVWLTGYHRELETVFWVVPRDKATSAPIPDSEAPPKHTLDVKGCGKRLRQIKRSIQLRSLSSYHLVVRSSR